MNMDLISHSTVFSFRASQIFLAFHTTINMRNWLLNSLKIELQVMFHFFIITA